MVLVQFWLNTVRRLTAACNFKSNFKRRKNNHELRIYNSCVCCDHSEVIIFKFFSVFHFEKQRSWNNTDNPDQAKKQVHVHRVEGNSALHPTEIYLLPQYKHKRIHQQILNFYKHFSILDINEIIITVMALDR